MKQSFKCALTGKCSLMSVLREVFNRLGALLPC